MTQVVESDTFVPVLSKYYNTYTNVWNNVLHDDIMETLSSLSFFKRLAKSVLNVFLPFFKFRTIGKENILFPVEDEVIIIVSGSLIVYDHRENF